MAKILTVEEMIAIEKKADAAGLSYDQMMENAGQAVADHIMAKYPEVAQYRVLILVGPGNNGGDGLVAGHYLSQAGSDVTYCLLKKRSAADINYQRVADSGAQIIHLEEASGLKAMPKLVEATDLLVDALLGTGFKLPMRGYVQKLLRSVQRAISKREHEPPVIVAVDCPSGVDCDTGETAEETLKADLTITLAAVKQGLIRSPGAEKTGVLEIGEIGLTPENSDLEAVELEMMEVGLARSILPARPKHAHKGTFGRLIIVAGCMNYPGAVILAAKGAYRSGVGLVTLAVPEAVYQPLVSALPEATWLLLPHSQGAIVSAAVEVLAGVLGSAQALLIGPGFGTDRESQQFLRKLFVGEGGEGRLGFVDTSQLANRPELPPLVLDADALKLMADVTDWEKLLPALSVLTPHPGEMSIMCGQTVQQIQRERLASARHWAAKWGHILVLKGANTVIASPTGAAMVVPIANAALAKAGTGDVLAGVIASLLAQGLEPYKAACLGVYLHARAGELAAQRSGTTASVLASEVADKLSAVYHELERGP